MILLFKQSQHNARFNYSCFWFNGTRARVSSTHGIALDNNGNIYISDTINNRIVAYSRNSPDGVTIAGGNGSGNMFNQLNKSTVYSSMGLKPL